MFVCRGVAFAAKEAAAVKQLAEELAAELAQINEVLNAACDCVKEADSSSNVRVVTTTATTATAAADSVSPACSVGALNTYSSLTALFIHVSRSYACYLHHQFYVHIPYPD